MIYIHRVIISNLMVIEINDSRDPMHAQMQRQYVQNNDILNKVVHSTSSRRLK
jgi:hypothetical protein